MSQTVAAELDKEDCWKFFQLNPENQRELMLHWVSQINEQLLLPNNADRKGCAGR